MRAILFLFFVVSTSSSTLLPIDNLSSTFSKLTTAHNRHFVDVLANTNINYTDYAGYDIDKITHLLAKESWKRALDLQGDMSPLIKRLNEKLTSVKRFDNDITFNVLYIGGSVCLGHGCLPPLFNQSGNGISTDKFLRASFHCSWPHRFTTFLQHTLSAVLGASSRVNVSPRYCCRAATSSGTGLDILLTRAYASPSKDCRGYGAGDTSNNDSWEPDLVLWDYSVNDMHSQWFRSRNRKEVYTGLVRTVLNLPSRPQLIDYETLVCRKDGSAQLVTQSQEDRRAVNRALGIPMISYQAALGMEVVPDYSPYYSESTLHRHPQWPTHVLWAQLLTEVILHALVDEVSEGKSNKSPSLSKNVSYGSGELESLDRKYVDNLGTTYGLCMQGYSSYADFDNRPHDRSEGTNSLPPDMMPSQLLGQWQFTSDVPSDPYKTGWVYERRFRRQSHVSRTEENFIEFQCHNFTYGRMKIGYISSYGGEWGSVDVSITAKIRSAVGTISTLHFNPFQIRSKWQLLVSVRQEYEVNLKTLTPLSQSDFKIPSGCRSPEVQEHCVESISARIQFVKESGRKFKLELIACC